MRILLETIPHKYHRYPTAGDWIEQANGDLLIRVSDMSNWRRALLIMVHELVEAAWCRQNNVFQYDVDKFDIKYEAGRPKGDDSEPGDQRDAPYYAGHQLASAIERLLAVALDVDWNEYEEEVANLFQHD